MDKKLSIEIVRLKAGIAQAINDTDVPACVVAMVLNEYLTNVNELAKQQYLADIEAEANKESEEDGDNTQERCG